MILPRVMRFNLDACADRYALLERAIGGESTDVEEAELALRFVQRVDRLAEQLDIPQRLDALRPDDFESITKEAVSEARSSYSVPKVMRRHHVTAVLESIRSGQRDLTFA